MSEKFIHGSPFLLRCSQPLSWFFMLYYTIADSVQQKKILTSNWFSYCHGSNRNSLCLFSDAGGYNPLKTKWLLHIHVFASLYGSNLCGKTLTWQNKWQICNSYGECLDIRYEYGTGAVKNGWKIKWNHSNSELLDLLDISGMSVENESVMQLKTLQWYATLPQTCWSRKTVWKSINVKRAHGKDGIIFTSWKCLESIQFKCVCPGIFQGWFAILSIFRLCFYYLNPVFSGNGNINYDQ